VLMTPACPGSKVLLIMASAMPALIIRTSVLMTPACPGSKVLLIIRRGQDGPAAHGPAAHDPPPTTRRPRPAAHDPPRLTARLSRGRDRRR
jgi:hypothetical protein